MLSLRPNLVSLKHQFKSKFCVEQKKLFLLLIDLFLAYISFLSGLVGYSLFLLPFEENQFLATAEGGDFTIKLFCFSYLIKWDNSVLFAYFRSFPTQTSAGFELGSSE